MTRDEKDMLHTIKTMAASIIIQTSFDRQPITNSERKSVRNKAEIIEQNARELLNRGF